MFLRFLVPFTDRAQVTFSYLRRSRQLNNPSILLAPYRISTGTGLEKFGENVISDGSSGHD